MTSAWPSRVFQRLYQALRYVGWARHAVLGVYLRATVEDARAIIADCPSYSRILIIRLDEIGDFVLTTPLLRELRARFPAAHISLLISSTVASLAYRCPYVDEIIQFEVRHGPPPFDQIMALARARRFAQSELADRKFQCAIIPRADIDNACALAMAYYAGIPVRIGYSECVLPLKRIKNAGYDCFLTSAVTSIVGTHEVEWTLNIGTLVGIKSYDRRLELWPSDGSIAADLEALVKLEGKGTALVAIAPGASLGRRRWPISRFAIVSRELITQRGARVVIIGGPDDRELARRIVTEGEAGKVLNFAGSLSLDQTALVLRYCQLFIGNDSGPMHIAAAMGVPCLEISCHPKGGDALAANSPLRFYPWGVDNVVLQPDHAMSPCVDSCTKAYSHCIRQITVDQVYMSACILMDKLAASTATAP